MDKISAFFSDLAPAPQKGEPMPEGMIHALLRIEQSAKTCSVYLMPAICLLLLLLLLFRLLLTLLVPHPRGMSLILTRLPQAQDFLDCFERNLDLSDTVTEIKTVSPPPPPPSTPHDACRCWTSTWQLEQAQR